MATKCFSPIFGKRIRVTELDLCGNVPAPGSEAAYVATDGFVTLTLTSEIEEGTEIITRKADGSLCVNEKAGDSFKRFTMELEFCGVNPDLFRMMTNADPYEDWAGDTAGITIDEGEIDTRFAFELWTGTTGGGACEGEGAEEGSGYLLLPHVTGGVLGDLEINGENAISFTVTGAFTRGGNQWGQGPYDVVLNGSDADVLPTPLRPSTHLLLMETGVAPPPSDCQAQPMPDYEPPVPPDAWAAETAYTEGDRVVLPTGEWLEAVTGGTSDATEPTAPSEIGGTVVDGDVEWERIF